MKNLLALFLVFFGLQKVSGQNTFLKTIATPHAGRNVRTFQTSDQGIAVFSLDSLKLYKFNRCGNAEWARQYNIPIGNYPGSIIQARNGNFALLNRIPDGSTLFHTAITLLNPAGNIIWSKSLEDPNQIQFPYTISEDNSGNFIVMGNASPLVQQGYFNFISKLDANGNLLWTKFYTFGPIWGGALVTSDNGILFRISGLIVKTDNVGNLEWTSDFRNTTHYLAPIEVSDGFIFTGLEPPANQICFYKINKAGYVLLGGRRIMDYTGNPPLLYLKSNGNFTGIFNKTVGGRNYASIYEFDKDLSIVRQSTLNFQQNGFSLQGLHVGFSDEKTTVLAGSAISATKPPVLFFGRTDDRLQIGCDTLVTAGYTFQPTTQTFFRTSSVIAQTFQVVNRPYIVKTIPAPQTMLCGRSATASLNIHADSLLCMGSQLTLQDRSATAFDAYLWSTGDTAASISVTKPGKYWLRATYNCGSQTVSDTVSVTEFSFPPHALTADSAICGGKPAKINAELPGATYKWADGSTDPVFLATRPGTYEVEITLGNCSKKFSTRIGDFEKVTLPNVFTPNHDGHNDAFTPMEMCGLASATLKIYNRWGQLLYTTSDLAQGWNGMVNGQKVGDGVYYYLLEYTNFRNELKKKKGWVELVGN